MDTLAACKRPIIPEEGPEDVY